MPRTVDVGIALEIHDCCTCGVQVGFTEALMERRRYDGANFYCPNGHTMAFNAGRAKLQRQLEESRAAAARARQALENERASNIAQRAATTRARNQRDRLARRAAHGICPCCGRTFKQLARHMKAKHPDFAPAGPHA